MLTHVHKLQLHFSPLHLLLDCTSYGLWTSDSVTRHASPLSRSLPRSWIDNSTTDLLGQCFRGRHCLRVGGGRAVLRSVLYFYIQVMENVQRNDLRQYQPLHYQNYNSIEMSALCVHVLLFWSSGMCNWETVPCSSSHQNRNVLKKLFKWSQSDYKKNFGDERNVGIVSVCWN